MKAEQKGDRGFHMSDPPDASKPTELPEMNFVTLVLSLSASAMMHLGAPVPGAEQPEERDLPLARQTIDILELLEQKTRGNLTQEELRVIEGVLHDLHLRYVEATRG